MCLYRRFQVLHRVEQAALEDASAAALPHDPDAAFGVQLSRKAAVLVERTGLTQSPAPLGLVLKPLSRGDHIATGL